MTKKHRPQTTPLRGLVILAIILGSAYALARVVGLDPFAAKAQAYVSCDPTGSGYSCSVEHRAGTNALHVCWSIRAECTGGFTTSASACQDVTPEGRSSRFVPQSAFYQPEKCSEVVAVSVEDLRITLAP